MKITIFGFLLFIFLTIYIIRNIKNPKLGNDLFFLSIVFLLIFDIGYFAKLGSFTVEYNYVFSVINLIFAIYTLCFKKREKKDLIILFSFLAFLFISLLIPLVFNLKYLSVGFNNAWDIYFGTNLVMEEVGFSFHSVPMFARCVIFCLSAYAFSKNITKEDLFRYSKILFKVSNFVIVFAIFEFLFTNLIDEFFLRKLFFDFFGHSEATYILPKIIGNGIYLPMGFMREPSSYARALFLLSTNNILLLMFKYKNKKVIINLICLMILLVVSKSLSAFIYLGTIIFIFLYLIKNKKIRNYILLSIPVILIVLFFIMGDRINNILGVFSILDKMPSELTQASETIRLYSIFNNLKYFIINPILGCGFGTIYSYSTLVTILTNIGIVGMLLYICVIYRITTKATNYNKFSWFTLIVILLTHSLIGHLSHLMYLETAAYLFICLKMIDCLKNSETKNELQEKIYVVSPYGLVTGGPDALHQMVYYLNKEGYDASIVYSDINSYKYPIPSPYRIYVDNYLLLDDIKDGKNNVLIVPETQSHLLKDYSQINKYIWWLSVDNDIVSSGFKNKIKKIIEKINIKNIKKIYKLNTLKNFILHKKYEFKKDDNIKHLCASYYAYDYVTKRCKNKDNVFLCIEPISKIFLDKSKLVITDKKNIILYNPKKNFEFTKKILQQNLPYKFIPLKGYNQDELIRLYQYAKLYIDFGNFPGAERIPKEAVINGCCIITGKFGASAYHNDVPIKDEYKFDATDENIDSIVEKINDVMENYDEKIHEYNEYRETVWNLESKFIKQLNSVLKK